MRTTYDGIAGRMPRANLVKLVIDYSSFGTACPLMAVKRGWQACWPELKLCQ